MIKYSTICITFLSAVILLNGCNDGSDKIYAPTSCPGRNITCQVKRMYSEVKELSSKESSHACFEYKQELILSNISDETVKVTIPKQRTEIFNLDNSALLFCELPKDLLNKTFDLKPKETISLESQGGILTKDKKFDVGIRLIIQEDGELQIFTMKIQEKILEKGGSN